MHRFFPVVLGLSSRFCNGLNVSQSSDEIDLGSSTILATDTLSDTSSSDVVTSNLGDTTQSHSAKTHKTAYITTDIETSTGTVSYTTNETTEDETTFYENSTYMLATTNTDTTTTPKPPPKKKLGLILGLSLGLGLPLIAGIVVATVCWKHKITSTWQTVKTLF
ncbi:unnamed protein product [Rotaria socialis]|uniref:Uncharacterized protein n=1 Tax=Rotaria socialis TaxID=392032 RepID=A0A820R264_9BILA|nr:unnamed protein product [Rotaria socialis]CAF4310399.1 unnamed protein product [Rotaria socialis]CAF4428290.1 unnamed protein product [Rotaria socialis]CAF4524507.1 unnamed protein product [Rotaria socialis]